MTYTDLWSFHFQSSVTSDSNCVQPNFLLNREHVNFFVVLATRREEFRYFDEHSCDLYAWKKQEKMIGIYLLS